MVRNLPASAGDMGSIPGLRRCRMPTKPVCHNYRVYTLEPVVRNKRIHHKKPAQLEKVRMQQRRPSTAKKKKIS